MIQKLRRHLTLLFLIPTSLILSLILFVLFFWQASMTRSEQAVNLQNQILNLTYQLEGAYFFSDDWLASLEYDHRLIIHIEDNRVPLLFSGSWTPRTDRDVLVELAREQALKEHIDALLGDLKERERQVIVLRFGLEDGHPRTLEEVGKAFNVTRERISQIEAKALRKLRNPVRSKRILDFL